MKLITVEAAFDVAKLDEATVIFEERADEVRAMPGCAHYALYRKTSNDGIAIVQQWQSQAMFEAYRESEVFASLGQKLRPLMASPPVTSVAELDTVNG